MVYPSEIFNYLLHVRHSIYYTPAIVGIFFDLVQLYTNSSKSTSLLLFLRKEQSESQEICNLLLKDNEVQSLLLYNAHFVCKFGYGYNWRT